MYQAAIDKIAARGLIRDRYDNFIGGKWVAPVEQLGVAPIFELRRTDIEAAVFDLTEKDVLGSDAELACRVAHRRRAVAAAARLVEHQRAVHLAQAADDGRRRLRNLDALDHGEA